MKNCTMDFRPIGKRRQLVRAQLLLQAFEEATESSIQNYGNAENKSEYCQRFCDSNFIPTLDNEKLLPNQEYKYPLGSISRTFYAQKIMEGILKANTSPLNLNEPFRKDNIITADIKTTLKKL